jgi:hypothetical protein
MHADDQGANAPIDTCPFLNMNAPHWHAFLTSPPFCSPAADLLLLSVHTREAQEDEKAGQAPRREDARGVPASAA